MKHTPRPWTVNHFVENLEKPNEAGIYEIEEANEQVLDLCGDDRHQEAVALAEANRLLVAAAPELLEALRDLLHDVDTDSLNINCAKGIARAAIAKAEGSEP